MKISCCIWALSGLETDVLRQARQIGFDWIDIQPTQLRSLESRLLAQELGLRVSCLGAGFGMPSGASLDHPAFDARSRALQYAAEAIRHAADLGATVAYIVPGRDRLPSALERFADSARKLADIAEEAGIQLAIEHFPDTALPTAAQTLEFIEAVGHDNLYLLYDSGHIQISGEEPAAVIKSAGPRLGYVHLDDNDGTGDLHWALLDGVMTEASLAETLQALRGIKYSGTISLELHPSLPNPDRALSESRDILLRALHQT